MGFKQLLTKVQQAEATLEVRERRVAAEWRQLKTTWKAAWTPGRVVIAGLVGGFLVGRAQPLRAAAGSSQFMQLVTTLSGLFAGGSAHVAAEEAQQAAQSAEGVADAVAPQSAAAASATASQAAASTEFPTPPNGP
ncbi:hypothetical protein ACFPOA_14355 [Lysobacter niabensis]|uniref:hypothetical protein n=1 Tax=Agrilutibacter niabensis TaxID=380628 RepID=UPI00360FE12D